MPQVLTTIDARLTAFLLAYARTVLERQFNLVSGPPPHQQQLALLDEVAALPYQKVNVTLRLCGAVKGCMSARETTLLRSVKQAVLNALQDSSREASVVRADVSKLIIEVGIQYERTPLDAHLSDDVTGYRAGVHGLELRYENLGAYYKPSVAITSEAGSLDRLLKKLCAKAHVAETLRHHPAVRLHYTSWWHLVEGSTEPYQLLRKPRPGQPTAAAVRHGAELAARRLRNTQRSDGSYSYIYRACKDVFEDQHFNMTRMAGTTYGMCRLVNYLQDQELPAADYLHSAEQAIGFLAELRREQQGTGLSYIAEGAMRSKARKGKLGAIALTALALQSDAFYYRHTELRTALLSSIQQLQQPDGRFQCYVHEYDNPNSQNFFPGEALLVLAYEYARSGDAALRQNLECAFPYYRAHFRTEPTTAFVLWQTDAWTRFFLALEHHAALTAGSSAYAEFVFEQIDWLLPLQYQAHNAPLPEYTGGFRYPGRPGCSTGTYTEAIIRAWSLARHIGDTARAARYHAAAVNGLQFLLRLQLSEAEAFLFPRPELAVGGVPNNVLSLVLRNDNDQHTLTAYLTALENGLLTD